MQNTTPDANDTQEIKEMRKDGKKSKQTEIMVKEISAKAGEKGHRKHARLCFIIRKAISRLEKKENAINESMTRIGIWPIGKASS